MVSIADDMVVFAALVAEGSFTRAATRLGITKQTVSERIAGLEDRLKARLVERTTRSVRVTEIGQRYFEHCRVVAETVQNAQRDLQQLRAEPAGVLRVSTPILYGRRYLGPIVSELLIEYPKLRVEVMLTDRYVDLVTEGIDVAVRVGLTKENTLVTRRLGESHLHCVASPALLKRTGVLRPSTPRALPCIGVRAVEVWTVRGARHKLEPQLVVNDLELCLDAAVSGAGIACLPSFLIRERVEAGLLQVVFGRKPLASRTLYAVYPSRKHQATATRVFLDLLAARFQPMSGL